MKNKGFTLIELLAVIVILAIIALIAIPMISKIIDKTEDSAVLRSAELYIDGVNQSIMRANLANKIRPKECIIQEDGNLICDGEYEIKIEATGTKPSAGTLIIEDRAVKSFTDMILDIYELEMKENEKIVIKSTIEGSDEPEKIKYASSELLEKVNNEDITIYTTGNIHEMYTFNHDATEQTEALTDYRYIGNDPYNYVTFNNETWRIIGVFTVEDKDGNKSQNIKIIKNIFLNERYPWDENSGDNNWHNSSLKNYLNNSYFNTFDDKSKEMVEDVKYYLGGAVHTTITSAENWYTYERGTNIYNKNSINWIGKIGLMYPSDYTYIYSYGIDDTCYSTGSCYIKAGGNPSLGWLYNGSNYWTITAPSNTSNCAFGLGSQGCIYNLTAGSGVRDNFYIRPVLYLSSNVKILSGTGQQTDPYTLEIS